jgi:hypothetical protein
MDTELMQIGIDVTTSLATKFAEKLVKKIRGKKAQSKTGEV